MTAATTAGSAPGESQAANHAATGKRARGHTLSVLAAANCQADKISSASPNPEKPAAGEESNAAASAGTSGASPRQARGRSASSQHSSAAQATNSQRMARLLSSSLTGLFLLSGYAAAFLGPASCLLPPYAQ